MGDRHLLRIFVGLNAALATCFVVYLFLSSGGSQQAFVTTNFPVALPRTNYIVRTVTAEVAPAPATNSPSERSGVTSLQTNELTVANTNAPAATNVIADSLRATFQDRRIGWEQLQSDEQTGTNIYKLYLDSLRAVGCPEEKVRYIVLSDINEMFSKKRLKEAVALDMKWWRSDLDFRAPGTLQEKGRSLEDERRGLITKYLGESATETERGEGLLWGNIQLTGPVLGNLTPEVHNAVQEIAARSVERSQNAQWARFNENQTPNAVETAKLREQTRAELRRVLNAEGMEEFLLRYSQNGSQLREELRGLEATPDEFRKILRATDPLDHQMQLEFGTVDSMSPQQRERHAAQREAAVREALGPQRFQDYLTLKDPLYRQARQTAMQYGAAAKVIMPIYQLMKASETQRQKILNDTTLTREQKNDEIMSVNGEQTRKIQQMIAGSKSVD
jgi:hypothetical protein